MYDETKTILITIIILRMSICRLPQLIFGDNIAENIAASAVWWNSLMSIYLS